MDLSCFSSFDAFTSCMCNAWSACLRNPRKTLSLNVWWGPVLVPITHSGTRFAPQNRWYTKQHTTPHMHTLLSLPVLHPGPFIAWELVMVLSSCFKLDACCVRISWNVCMGKGKFSSSITLGQHTLSMHAWSPTFDWTTAFRYKKDCKPSYSPKDLGFYTAKF